MAVETLTKPPRAVARTTQTGPASGPRRQWWDRRGVVPYLLIAPAVLFELLVHVIPMVAGVVMSLFSLTLFTIHHWSTAPFAGFANYHVALNFNGPIGRALLQSFEITVPYTILVVGISWVIGMVAAVGLNSEFRGRGWLRSVFLLPYAMPLYVGIIVWSFMLQRNNGVVNNVLQHDLHLLGTAPFWLLGNKAFWAIVATAVWRWFPFAFLMLLAALQNIPGELYEAAVVDGAKPWRQFRSITLPSVRGANLVLVLVMFLWTFNDFNTPYVLFGSAPPNAADLLSLHIYIVSFGSWNFGLGSAMSVVLMVFLFLVSLVYLRVAGRKGELNF
ncbi:MAG TPA: sugar ABC transporter permease [Acidimicrobiales bacterium]|nr:sugar ABC transporter permease [Acidimicrobiales bacterium]